MHNSLLLTDSKKYPRYGVSLDGVNDYINYSPSTVFNLTTNFSLAVFFKKIGGVRKTLLGKIMTGTTGWFVTISDTMIQFYRGNYYTNIPYSLTLNTINCLLISLDSTQERYYMNGILILQKERTSATDDNGNFTIGMIGLLSGFFDGVVYDVKIFNQSFTNEESEKYNKGIIPANPIFNANFESVYKIGSNIFIDSAIGNRGTVLGKPAGSPCIVDINGNNIQLTP